MAPSSEDGNSLFNFVVRDGNGVKGLTDSGLSKVPDQYIQPPNEQFGKTTAAHPHDQPAIDLSGLDGPNHDQVVEAVAKAAETLGFFQVVKHGVPVQLLEAVKEGAHRFFGQPTEKKAVYMKGVSTSPLVKYGTSFLPEVEKTLEWKDFLNMVYTNDEDALQHWPNQCKEAALEYLNTSTQLVRRLLAALIGHLGVRVDESRVEALIGLRMVNMNFYPPCPNPELTVGVGRHSDLGILTVLLQYGIGGLYVKVEDDTNSRRNRGEEWMEIPPIPGALVINVGDTLQILSNGRYKSAEHKVRTTSTQSRVSIPLFTMPRSSEKIAPLPHLVERDGVARYQEFIFDDYMNNFFSNAHEGKKPLEFAQINSQ
ncbi:hypothetical protein CsSME_00025878 [Camellia sinensis var. sinensis]